jgi:threonine dehydrogenase-like Zn-dependent dehydrogenase
VGVGKQNLDFFYSIIQTKELEVMGSRNALKEDFIELIAMVKTGKVNLEAMITDVYDYREAGAAFEAFSVKGADKLKVLLKF